MTNSGEVSVTFMGPKDQKRLLVLRVGVSCFIIVILYTDYLRIDLMRLVIVLLLQCIVIMHALIKWIKYVFIVSECGEDLGKFIE